MLLMVVIFVIKNTGTNKNTASEYDEELVDALRVGVHYDVNKMGYRQYYDQEVEGFEIDLSKQLAKHLYGKESLIELNNVSSKTAKYFLSNKTVDCIIATLPLTEEKEEGFKFSNPYYTDYVECVYSQGNIMSINDLKGKRIGVIEASYTHKRVEALLKDAKIEAQFVAYESYSDGLLAVQNGKIDTFCMNRVFLPASNLKRFTLTECKYAIMVREEDTELLKKINGALESLTNSGELSLIADKWK